MRIKTKPADSALILLVDRVCVFFVYLQYIAHIKWSVLPMFIIVYVYPPGSTNWLPSAQLEESNWLLGANVRKTNRSFPQEENPSKLNHAFSGNLTNKRSEQSPLFDPDKKFKQIISWYISQPLLSEG